MTTKMLMFDNKLRYQTMMGDDYEDAVDCDQVARIRLRLVLLAFGYAAWIDTCYCWKRPDILVDVIGTLESSNV